jgi:hypothetical protein
MQTSTDCPPENGAAVTRCGHCLKPAGDESEYRIHRTAKADEVLEIDWVLLCRACLAEHDANE